MSSYLDAAFEVLARQGSALHYTIIAKAAGQLGLLQSGTRTPAIVFSSTLSRAAGEFPNQPFRKAAPGVYELPNSFELFGINGTDECCFRIDALKRETGVADPRSLIIKGLYLLRNAIALAGSRFVIELGGARIPFRLKPAAAHQLGVELRPPRSLPMELDFVRAAAKLRTELQCREVMHVFVLALALLQEALVHATESRIRLSAGDHHHQQIRLF